MPHSPGGLLSLPAAEAAQRLLLTRLEVWRRLSPRLDDAEDTEALHDFRVALRRLRTIIRAFRSAVDDRISGKLRRRLRRLADATGASRDLEVQRAWLVARLPQLSPRQRSEGRWLLARLERLEASADEALREQIEKRFGPLEEQLQAALTEPQTGADDGLTAAVMVGAALRDGSALLSFQLRAIHSITDDADAHEARILAKRLRYLLEAFAEEIPGAASLIDRLKKLQDLLGDLHDLHRLAAELRSAFRETAVQRADRVYHHLLPWGDLDAELPPIKAPTTGGGLAGLVGLVREEAETLFARLQREWLDGGGGAALCTDLDALGRAVTAVLKPGVEIERKYLLSGVPPAAADAPSQEIEQGWLPGTTVVERLRHVTSADGEAWYRTVKAGQGLQRIELEEATTRDLFEALWPLTEACRVRKRRHTVSTGPVHWEVDEFLDRDLVLAEIELPSAEAKVEVPDWLRDYLIREVTGESAYVNRVLAR